MRCDMPDVQFLQFVDLDHPIMTHAKQLAGRRRYREAAREVARAMFAQPLPHPINEDEIPALAKIVNQRWPDQVAWLRRLADNYLLRTPKNSGILCGENREQEQTLYRTPARVWIRRGDAPQALARLYHLTGDTKYLRASIELIRGSFAAARPLPDDQDAGAFIWHPRPAAVSHDLGHLLEKICHALPFLRTFLDAGDALILLKGFLAEAEFNFRSCRYDVTHNITLHMLLSCLLVGLLFPAFRPARQWVEWVQDRVEQDFTSRSFVTPDGYFGEGFAYQTVNQNLMFIALRYLQASEPQGLTQTPPNGREIVRVCRRHHPHRRQVPGVRRRPWAHDTRALHRPSRGAPSGCRLLPPRGLQGCGRLALSRRTVRAQHLAHGAPQP